MESPHHSSPESEAHQDDPQGTRKRKRKTFSCDACRKRKLKCDREFPVCGRCQKSGNAATCVYESMPEPVAKSAITPSRFPHISEPDLRGSSLYLSSEYASPQLRQIYQSPNHPVDRIAVLESRIAQIDPNLGTGEHAFKRARLDYDANVEPPSSKGKDSIGLSFYGAGFKTGFFGPSSERNTASYYPAIIRLYPELKIFASFNNLQGPFFVQIRGPLTALRKNSKVAKKIMPYPTVMTLFDAVPDKDMCTKMVSLYWETIASTYHIYHGPTFWSSYWVYWGDAAQRTETFACTILLMLASVNCFQGEVVHKYRGLSNIAREQALYWIDACEAWMNRQSRKHLTIESFQHRVLLEIAKQVNAVKKKQVWEHANALMAFAISTGLHQDPSKIDNTYVRDQMQGIPHKPKTTPYEKEMRRRLWAAVVELEMQASMDKGIPSSRLALLSDCGRPSLLIDESFDESSTALPEQQPRSKYTAISYLRLSQETLRLRASLSEIINAGAERLTYEDILAFDDEIKRALNDLPEWVKEQNDDGGSSPKSHSSSSPAALLELQLRQLQLLLHIPFARRAESDSRSNLSRMTCIDTAVRILKIHVQLGRNGASSLTSHWLNLIREDVFRAILAISYNLVLWRGLNNDLSSLWMKDIYTERAVQGMELFKIKVLALGEHFVQLWYTLAAVGMFRATYSLNDINLHISQVADDLFSIFALVCNSQEEPSNEQTAAGALTALATPNSNGYEGGTGTTPMPMPDLAAAQPFVDGVDMSNWAFDDLWPFNNTGLSW